MSKKGTQMKEKGTFPEKSHEEIPGECSHNIQNRNIESSKKLSPDNHRGVISENGRSQDKTTVICKYCKGTGFRRPYNGICHDGKRHEYSLPNGKRSDKCLRCGHER